MPDPTVVQVVREHKALLLAREADQMRDMAGRWVQLERSLEDKIALVARQLRDIADAGRVPSQSALYSMERYQSLLAQLKVEMEGYVDYADGLITARQTEMAGLGIDHAGQAIQASYAGAGRGVGTFFDRLPVEAVEGMVGLAGDGSPLRSLLKQAYPDAADGMTRALIRSTALGINPRQTAAAVQYLTNPDAAKAGMADGLNRILTIARTEQLRVYRMTQLEQMRASGVVKGYKRIAALQTRTCAACLMADGTYYDLATDFVDHVCGRCGIVPVVRGLKEITWKQGPEWFGEQDEATQRTILGKGRYDLWKAGEFNLSQLVTVKPDATWGDSLQVTPVGVLKVGRGGVVELEKAGARWTPLAVISEQGIDDMVKDGATLMYRGVKGDMSHDAQYYVDKLMSGEHSGNKSLYGTGLFVAVGDGALSTATTYAGENGIILKGAISKKAKIITDSAARAAITTEKQLLDSNLSSTITRLAGVGTSKSKSQIGEAIIKHGKLQNQLDAYVRDPTQWAKDKGYDAVRQRTAATSSEEMVILNTRVVTVAPVGVLQPVAISDIAKMFPEPVLKGFPAGAPTVMNASSDPKTLAAFNKALSGAFRESDYAYRGTDWGGGLATLDDLKNEKRLYSGGWTMGERRVEGKSATASLTMSPEVAGTFGGDDTLIIQFKKRAITGDLHVKTYGPGSSNSIMWEKEVIAKGARAGLDSVERVAVMQRQGDILATADDITADLKEATAMAKRIRDTYGADTFVVRQRRRKD